MAESSGIPNSDEGSSPVHHHWWGLALKISLALLVVGLGAWAWFAVLQPREADLERLLGELGPWGPVLFVAIFVVATMLFFPESVLSIAAGAIFGLVGGLAWTAVGGLLAVAATFVVGRTVLGRRVRASLAGHPRLAAIEQATESQGARLAFLLRLSPLNFSLLNWMLAVSRLRFRVVMLTSLGMIPGNLSTTYMGYAARHTADLATRANTDPNAPLAPGDSIAHEIALYSGLVASVVVSVLVTRIAVRALKASTPEPTPD